MNVLCPRDALTAAVDETHALAAKSKRPECRTVHARAADGKLTLRATADTETALTVEVPDATVAADGVCLLPLKFHDVLRCAPAGDVRLRCDRGTLRVTTGVGTPAEYEYELPTADPKDFPDVAADAPEPAVECAARDLRDAIRRTAFAAATDEGKYAMQGTALFRVGDTETDKTKGKTKLVGTDGKRLAVCDLPGAFHAEHLPAGSLIVPSVAVETVNRLAGRLEDGDPVSIAFGADDGGKGNCVHVRAGGATVWARLVEGRFPPWQDVIPKRFNCRVPLAAGEFLEAVKAAAVTSEDESRRVRFEFRPGIVRLYAQGPQVGTSNVPLILPEYAGGDIDISFDPAMLVEYLRTVVGERIELRMVDGSKSAVFFRSDESSLCLIVPLV